MPTQIRHWTHTFTIRDKNFHVTRLTTLSALSACGKLHTNSWHQSSCAVKFLEAVINSFSHLLSYKNNGNCEKTLYQACTHSPVGYLHRQSTPEKMLTILFRHISYYYNVFLNGHGVISRLLYANASSTTNSVPETARPFRAQFSIGFLSHDDIHEK